MKQGQASKDRTGTKQGQKGKNQQRKTGTTQAWTKQGQSGIIEYFFPLAFPMTLPVLSLLSHFCPWLSQLCPCLSLLSLFVPTVPALSLLVPFWSLLVPVLSLVFRGIISWLPKNWQKIICLRSMKCWKRQLFPEKSLAWKEMALFIPNHNIPNQKYFLKNVLENKWINMILFPLLRK